MAKYKVMKQFRLLDDVNVPDVGPIQEVDTVIDIKVKRAEQVIDKLGSSFLERIDEQKKVNDEELQDELAEKVTEEEKTVEEAE